MLHEGLASLTQGVSVLSWNKGGAPSPGGIHIFRVPGGGWVAGVFVFVASTEPTTTSLLGLGGGPRGVWGRGSGV